MKKINRSKLVVKAEVVRVLRVGDLDRVAGGMENLDTKLGHCASIGGWSCIVNCMPTASGCV